MHPGIYIVLGVFVLLIIWGVSYQKKIKKNRFTTLKTFADKYSLAYDLDELNEGIAKLSGELNGIHFSYHEAHMPLTDPENPVFWTVLRFSQSPFDFKFKISQEIGLMKVAKTIGFEDTQIGVEEIDAAFYFQTNVPERLQLLLNGEIQSELIQLKEELNGIIENEPERNTFTYYYFGRIQQSFQIEPVEKVLDFMKKIQVQ